MAHQKTSLKTLYKEHKETVNAVLLVVIIIGGIYAFNFGLKIVLNTEYPIVVVSSESMVPTLNVGDLLILKGVDPKDIKVGDIIVFRATWLPSSEPPVVHRVIEIENRSGTLYFYTKGDNNRFQDPEPAPAQNVIGVVIFVIPRIGLVSLWLRQSGIFGPIVLVIIIIILILTFGSTEEEEEEKKKETTKEENQKNE